jgi:hypothetical protein
VNSDKHLSSGPDAAIKRNEDDEDLDLLTYNEARARLAEEVAAEEKRLEALRTGRQGRAGDDASTADVSASEQRVQALRDALKRTESRALTESNAADFYGTDL